MPGVVGLIQSGPDQNISKMFADMLAPMDRGGRLLTERSVDSGGHWGLGRVHLGVFQKDPQLVRKFAIQVPL